MHTNIYLIGMEIISYYQNEIDDVSSFTVCSCAIAYRKALDSGRGLILPRSANLRTALHGQFPGGASLHLARAAFHYSVCGRPTRYLSANCTNSPTPAIKRVLSPVQNSKIPRPINISPFPPGHRSSPRPSSRYSRCRLTSQALTVPHTRHCYRPPLPPTSTSISVMDHLWARYANAAAYPHHQTPQPTAAQSFGRGFGNFVPYHHQHPVQFGTGHGYTSKTENQFWYFRVISQKLEIIVLFQVRIRRCMLCLSKFNCIFLLFLSWLNF